MVDWPPTEVVLTRKQINPPHTAAIGVAARRRQAESAKITLTAMIWARPLSKRP